jgi:protein-tyrosine phosphatase
MERWLTFEGCDNFRDLGGYATRDGSITRWNMLYRSDSLGRLTEAAVRQLEERVRPRVVVDLRTPDESVRLPLAADLAACCISLPMDNPEIDAIRRAGVEGMGELYLWNLEVKRASFVKMVRVLADETRLPAVIQCNGGKDRTGLAVALVLEVLGVPDETIIADYTLTDEVRARIPQARHDEAVERLSAAGLDPAIIGARADTMAEFLQGFRERYRSATDYLVAGGVTRSDLDALRANLLETATEAEPAV